MKEPFFRIGGAHIPDRRPYLTGDELYVQRILIKNRLTRNTRKKRSRIDRLKKLVLRFFGR